MTTKQELASDPDIRTLSTIDDTMLRALSPFARAVVEVSREIVSKTPRGCLGSE